MEYIRYWIYMEYKHSWYVGCYNRPNFWLRFFTRLLQKSCQWIWKICTRSHTYRISYFCTDRLIYLENQIYFWKFRSARAMVGKIATHDTLMLFVQINIDCSDSLFGFTNSFMAINHLKKYSDVLLRPLLAAASKKLQIYYLYDIKVGNAISNYYLRFCFTTTVSKFLYSIVQKLYILLSYLYETPVFRGTHQFDLFCTSSALLRLAYFQLCTSVFVGLPFCKSGSK